MQEEQVDVNPAHTRHQAKMQQQLEDKARRRRWHRDPRRKRSIPPIILV